MIQNTRSWLVFPALEPSFLGITVSWAVQPQESWKRLSRKSLWSRKERPHSSRRTPLAIGTQLGCHRHCFPGWRDSQKAAWNSAAKSPWTSPVDDSVFLQFKGKYSMGRRGSVPWHWQERAGCETYPRSLLQPPGTDPVCGASAICLKGD